ncbi:MAG TPA: potassium-transporting ATPase subunit KdpA [Thermoanaerobaculia bacterium]|jgi:K+-transporting ATPase ATPase A chain|nr:potassium-transporting ATPase subunit KdpA [Thermoanaerobaculia bacterium]
MTTIHLLEVFTYLAILTALTPLLGGYLKRVFSGERTLLDPVLRPLERGIYRVCGVDASKDQGWVDWTVTMLVVNAASLVILYAMQRLQAFLPFNPNRFGAVSPDSSWNTAVSFTTNTNWQGYSGETTMSHFTQMAGLALHNFLSAATGIAIAVAVIRGIAREKARGIGNFWYDCTRAILWVLLPFSFLAALFFVSRGVVQNFRADVTVTTVEGAAQKIAQGPVASQEAIKELGTNGGGFFNANSAHPYENPTPGTNFVQMLLIFAIAAGLTNTLGRMTGSIRHGWAVFGAMTLLFLAGVFVVEIAEQKGNPIHQKLGVAALPTAGGTGGNMEGKEVRFGVGDSALFSAITTDASCGAINSWHDSFTPIGGLVPLANIATGEVVFGGVGAGLYGMFLFIVLSVFIAGLMVGRTPEYLGKKIEAHEVKLAMLSVLVLTLCILGFSAAASVLPAGLSSLNNKGPHGFTEILYAFVSGAGNNGSAFAGLNANTLFYNTTLGVDMFFGRFFMLIPILGIAGSLASKKKVPESAGTFPVTGPLFSVLLVSVILIVGALTFFPAFSLGPIVEQLLMKAGTLF